ncbi:MAG: crossover junction endodeoxyribonuclease RuvC [Bacteroidia bacterium]|nr:crossover junction endodeoxyribonuclease RuvC [Bacteroidia bacterium]
MSNLEGRVILGVDPGTMVTGYALLQVIDNQPELKTLGVILLDKQTDDSFDKLQKIFRRITSIIEEFQPDWLAIEAPFYGVNIQSAIKLGRVQGVVMAAALSKGISVHEYAPRKVKQAITGRGNASKEQVAAMLIQQFPQAASADMLDATDALALALCHYYQLSAPIPDLNSNYPKKSKKRKDQWQAFIENNPNRIL